MFNKSFYFFFLILIPFRADGQECSFTINGKVIDADSSEPLELVNLYLEELNAGTATDSSGTFTFNGLCKKEYHLVSSHIGCETQRLHLDISSDTTLIILMDHSAHLLHDVVISSEANEARIQKSEAISEKTIAENSYKNLSRLLENIVGVSSLKNGSQIAKPVVHGMYGNRLTILNNGVPQSGQQWGNDHSPEIDPLMANSLKVIKGTGAISYMGSNLGSIVLVEPKKIPKEPHIHGRIGYFFESNGRSHGVHTQLRNYKGDFGWKVMGTYKQSGDRSTPEYFLNNTGSKEVNLALQLEKKWSDQWNTDLFVSTFNAQFGVLRGSHIGNLTDLEKALQRNVPFNTETEFSYSIDAPYQDVNHHLLKLSSTYFIDDDRWVSLVASGQINQRDEFDVRRGGRSSIPSLSIGQNTFFGEMRFQQERNKSWNPHIGAQFRLIDNTNNPETGILPLIPDYLHIQSGLFASIFKSWDNYSFELGARLDLIDQEVLTISNRVPREIIRFDNRFTNYNLTTGIERHISDHYEMSLNVGFSTRNPAINELYSNGLHQGVSGIEEGNPELISEKALKVTLNQSLRIKSSVAVEALMYHQKIDNYIFLQPQDEFRLTIRGAFPVFNYTQTDATISGIDLSTRFNISDLWHTNLKYSYIYGNDNSNDLPLIFLPSNTLAGNILYEFKKPLRFLGTAIENLEIDVSGRKVFRQSSILPSQDFLLPPDGYFLTGLSATGDIQLRKLRLSVSLKMENLFNIRYRDYLNRQRYFADDLGRNMIIGLNVRF